MRMADPSVHAEHRLTAYFGVVSEKQQKTGPGRLVNGHSHVGFHLQFLSSFLHWP